MQKDRHQLVSSTFSIAKAVPLFKKGDKSFEGNYRPVNITCHLKILERVIYNQVCEYTSEKDITFDLQTGLVQNIPLTLHLLTCLIQ